MLFEIGLYLMGFGIGLLIIGQFLILLSYIYTIVKKKK